MAPHVRFDGVGAIIWYICWILSETRLKRLEFQTSCMPLHASDKWRYISQKVELGKIGLCFTVPCDKIAVFLAQLVNRCAEVAFDSPPRSSWHELVLLPKVTKVLNRRIIVAVHRSKALQSARGWAGGVEGWNSFMMEGILFQGREFHNSFMGISGTVNCGMLMRRPASACPRVRALTFFPVVLYLGLRPFLSYSLGGCLSITCTIFSRLM